MKLFSVSLALLFASVSLFAQQERNYDVLHYSFSLQLSDESDTIIGKAVIKLRFTAAADKMELDLTSVQSGKGMTVTKLSDGNSDIPFTHADNKIAIPNNAKKGDSATIVVEYKGIPSDGLIIARNKYGHRTFFADNWPNRGHNWIPCNDVPGDKAPVEFIVTAPEHYQVVANGIQVEETNLGNKMKLTHWKEDAPVATKIMVIGVADFAVNLAGTVGCIPVFSWVYPEDRDKGFYDYALAVDILPFFIKNVGPFGYKKLANVESKTIFGGLENAGAIFYSEKSITGTRSEEDLLAHEIAHQWFGDMATEKKFAHIWLSEGFATYFKILYFESKYGKDTAAFMRREDRQTAIAFAKSDNSPIVNEAITDYMDLLTPNSYQRAGCVLHMLRRELGDSTFWKGIRAYYAAYAGGNADTEDFKHVMEKVSGKKLDLFFTQWLYTGTYPKLDVSWRIDKNKKLIITVKQLQSTPFTFPLEIGIVAGGKSKTERLTITKQQQLFTLDAPGAVSGIMVDPDVNLFCEQKVSRAN